jgi:cytoskeletal protein CcmA (bactofilin family)
MARDGFAADGGAVRLGPVRMSIFGKSGPTSPDPEAPRHETRTAFVGPKVRIHGELAGEEDIVVEGRVDGRVDVSKSVRIGAHGEVHGDVHAQILSIAGKVWGDVSADERVELLPSASLEGNIRAPKIVISEGAQFRGRVDMGSPSGPDDEPESGGPV